MAWREPTESDILDVLSEPERAGYLAAATADGQDVLTGIFGKVVDFCRGYIADNKANKLAAGMTLPERVMRPAMHIARKDLLTRLDMEVSKDRADDAKEALRFFERVSDGKVEIELPEGATDDSGTGATFIETISSNERQATREKMAGL
jgi:hypothetical protein